MLYQTARERIALAYRTPTVRSGEIEIARKGYERILELDTSECGWYVEPSARGFVYEFDKLNIGQPSPHFAARDIDGNTVDLKDHRGKAVLLSFWSMNCPGCPEEFAYLRESRRKYPEDRYLLVGVSSDVTPDPPLEKLRRYVEEERLCWPQICEGNDWFSAMKVAEHPIDPARDDSLRPAPLRTLFNIQGLPNTIILDETGIIVGKRKRGADILTALDSLLA